MEQGAFIEQTIPLGGKLSKARQVFAREKRPGGDPRCRRNVCALLTLIRVLYYETLGAQRLVELRDDLSQLAREAVEITKELSNVGQADRPDQLEIEIEAERAEIDFLEHKTTGCDRGKCSQRWSAIRACSQLVSRAIRKMTLQHLMKLSC